MIKKLIFLIIIFLNLFFKTEIFAYNSFSTLTENFDDNSINTSIWNAYSYRAGSSAIETGGEAVLTVGNGGWAYATFDSQNFYDLTNSEVFVKVSQTLNANNAAYTQFWVRKDDSNYIGFQVYGSTKKLYITKNVAGAGDITLASTTYNGTDQLWWKIKENSGIIYFQISSDCNSWTDLATLSDPFVITGLKVRMTGIANNVAASSAHFDNFNIVPAAPSIDYFNIQQCLNWSVNSGSASTTVSINQGIGNVSTSGLNLVNSSTTLTYTITATSTVGSSTASVIFNPTSEDMTSEQLTELTNRLDAVEITLICLAVIFGLTFIRNLLFSSRYK